MCGNRTRHSTNSKQVLTNSATVLCPFLLCIYPHFSIIQGSKLGKEEVCEKWAGVCEALEMQRKGEDDLLFEECKVLNWKESIHFMRSNHLRNPSEMEESKKWFSKVFSVYIRRCVDPFIRSKKVGGVCRGERESESYEAWKRPRSGKISRRLFEVVWNNPSLHKVQRVQNHI